MKTKLHELWQNDAPWNGVGLMGGRSAGELSPKLPSMQKFVHEHLERIGFDASTISTLEKANENLWAQISEQLPPDDFIDLAAIMGPINPLDFSRKRKNDEGKRKVVRKKNMNFIYGLRATHWTHTVGSDVQPFHATDAMTYTYDEVALTMNTEQRKIILTILTTVENTHQMSQTLRRLIQAQVGRSLRGQP